MNSCRGCSTLTLGKGEIVSHFIKVPVVLIRASERSTVMSLVWGLLCHNLVWTSQPTFLDIDCIDCFIRTLQSLVFRTAAQPVFNPQTTVSVPSHLPDHIGGFRAAHSTFAKVESRYGLVFPRSSPQK